MSQLHCPAWEKPETNEQLPHVIIGLREFYSFIVKACQRRYIPNHGDFKTQHRNVFEQVVPLHYYAGNYRADEQSRPCLRVNVHVNGVPGDQFPVVPDSMQALSESLRGWMTKTDEFVARMPAPTERARAVCELAACVFAEFIRIHPFLNGNGRMGRMLVNFVFKRYGYAMPFVQAYVRPPEAEYAHASSAAMGHRSDPQPFYRYLLILFARNP